LLINKAEPTHARKQQVFAADVLAWCAHNNIRHFYETSALSDTNVLIALVNITQLAADCDLQRRGVKVACDAAELARQEARQAREVAEAAARAAAEAEAARLAAEARAEAERRLEADRLEAEAKREADFEARWALQRAEAEEAAKRIEEEKEEKAARARERAEKRRATIALSAYGSFKQRPHRLSAALIQQHAAAAEEAHHAILLGGSTAPGGRPASSSADPRFGGGGGGQQLGSVTPVQEGERYYASSSSPNPSALLLPRKPGTLPPFLHATPRILAASRPSALGQGTGALLKRLEAGTNATRPPAGGVSARSASAAANDVPSTSITSLPHPPATGVAPAGGRRRPHQRGPSFNRPGGGGDSAAAVGDDGSLAALAAQPAHADADAASFLSDEALLALPVDPLTEALLDVVAPQVHFTRVELLRLHAPFAAAAAAAIANATATSSGSAASASSTAEDGLSYAQWKHRCWRLVSARVPAWLALSERFFAAMDLEARGRVDFEDYAVALAALMAPSEDNTKGPAAAAADARAKLLFRVCDYAHVPFVPVPKPAAVDADEEAEAGAKTSRGNEDEEESKEESLGSNPSRSDDDNDEGEKDADVSMQPTKDEKKKEAGPRRLLARVVPVTKHSVLLKQQRELQGVERFAFDLYDASATSPPSSSSSADRFITRDCVTKVLLAVLLSLPSAQSLLSSSPSASCALVDGPRSTLVLTDLFRRTVRRRVDNWWAAAGHAHAFCLSEMQWRDAVTRVPDIIQPFAPPAPSSSHAGNAAATASGTSAASKQTAAAARSKGEAAANAGGDVADLDDAGLDELDELNADE
jgi:hypothetical protein